MKTYEQRTQSIMQKAQAQKIKRNKTIKLLSICSGALALVLAVNLVLFVPYEVGGVNIDAYRGSEYFSLIQSLSKLAYSPYRTNNFKEWFGDLKFGTNIPNAEAPSSGDNEHSPDYDDVTLNQTENVTEGDLFKRNANNIFYLGYTPAEYSVIINESEDGYTKTEVYVEATYDIRAYSIEGENSELVATYKIEPEKDTTFLGYTNMREMFVSADGNSLTVLSPCYDRETRLLYTTVIRLDVSDVNNITETNRIYVSGSYVSSRVADDTMLLISNFAVPRRVNFDNEANYIPQIGALGALEKLPAADIIVPDNASIARYTVICAIDNATLEPTDAVALLSYSNDVYVSQNNLFVPRGFLQTYEADEKFAAPYSLDRTEIRIVSYGDGKLENAGSVTVDGTVLDRYSLDEYDGVLRAVTTATYRNAGYVGTGVTEVDDMFPTVTCNLYCFDIASLDNIATVERFAPIGESVRSARFYGDTAYVCTAEVRYYFITDPVFAFDLSDYDNVTYKDTGTIPGYSLSLAEFKDDTLIGIGYGDTTDTLKIELYTQTDNNVTSVAQYEKESVRFSSRYKAHFIDKNNGLVGLCMYDFTNGNTVYKLLRYDGYTLTEILSQKMNNEQQGLTEPDYARATYINGYIYIFGDNDFIVKSV